MVKGEQTAEWLAQRAFDLELVSQRQLESVWSQLGTRDVPLSDFRNALQRSELLTKFQIERIIRGDRAGYFYGDYKVLYLLGAGSFARAYRAVHKETGKAVVLKVLRRRFSDDPAQREQFTREGNMGTTLRHPNIVRTFEVCSQGHVHFLVLEFIEGRTLREFIKIRRKIEPLEATRLMADIVAALQYASKRNICHRDLKPTNVLVCSSGKAMLVDFGLAGAARDLDDPSSEAGNPRTIDYGSLEKATNAPKDDARTDLYFAGCIYYHMLTGESPLLETRDRMVRSSINRFLDVRPITELEPQLPIPVVTIVNKAMELNPERRYQTPGDLLYDLHSTQERLQAAADGDEEAAAALAAPLEKPPEGLSHAVMIVESNSEMQDLLRQRLKKYGYRVLVIGNPDLAMTRVQEKKGLADVVLFSTGELGRPALDAFNQLGRLRTTKKIPAVLMLGEGHGAWQEEAELADHRRCLSMPIRLKELRTALAELVDAKA